jgi:hypothetical protein
MPTASARDRHVGQDLRLCRFALRGHVTRQRQSQLRPNVRQALLWLDKSLQQALG